MSKQTGANWIGKNEVKHSEYIDRRIDQQDKQEVMTAMYGDRVRVNNR